MGREIINTLAQLTWSLQDQMHISTDPSNRPDSMMQSIMDAVHVF